MKYKSLNLASRFPVFSGLVLGILLAGCSAGDAVLPDADPDPEPGEPVTLTFDMYSASVTRADAASTSEDMAIGKIFRIYAFPAGSTNPFLLYIRKNSSPPAVRNRRRCVTGASASREPILWKIFWITSTGCRSWAATASFCSSSCPIPLWPAGITTR